MSTVPLRRIASMAYGDALASEDREDGPVPVMSSGGVTGQHSSANTLAPAIIIGRKGSHGSLWWTDVPAFVIDTAYYIDDRHTHEDLRWLFYALSTLNLRSVSSDVGVPGLSREKAYELGIQVPTVEEQRRIADFLDDRVAQIDQIIAARQQQRASIDRAFRALEYRLTTTGVGETRPTTIEWMPRIASDSKLWRLSRAFATGSGTTPLSDSTEYYGEGTPWVTTSDLRDNLITELPRSVTDEAFRDYSALKTFPAGTLLIAMYGATVGRLGILDCAAATNQACCAMLPLGPVDTVYAFHWLHAQRPHIVALASGGGQPNISQEVVRSLYIPAPDIELQEAAVAELARYESTAKEADTTLARQISLLQEYKQSLITAAVTGEFDVTTASTRIPE